MQRLSALPEALPYQSHYLCRKKMPGRSGTLHWLWHLCATVQGAGDRSAKENAGIHSLAKSIDALHGNPAKEIGYARGDQGGVVQLDLAARPCRTCATFYIFWPNGFQNHDEIPGLKWTEPKDEDAIKRLALDNCSKVAINGRITFTVDNLETLYDEAIEQKEMIEEKARAAGKPKSVAVAKLFNTEPDFARFLSELTIEALRGEGRLLEISQVSAIKPPLSDDEG